MNAVYLLKLMVNLACVTIRTLNEDKVIVQELSLALFQDFANLQSLYVQVVKMFRVR